MAPAVQPSEVINFLGLRYCFVLVLLSQVGFCFLEAGCVRSINVVSILFKNIGDISIGCLCWWLVGYGLAYGKGTLILGTDSMLYAYRSGLEDPIEMGNMLLSFPYVTTCVTIISGCVAERIRVNAYFIFVVLVTSISFPILEHCVNSNHGLISSSNPSALHGGVLDSSRAITVHVFGGTCALVFGHAVGPRQLQGNIDVFTEEGQKLVSGHNKFQLSAGILILWWTWFAFTIGTRTSLAPFIVTNTLLASAASTCVGIVASKLIMGYYDIHHMCSCVQSGLVSITAGAAYVSPWAAVLIGASSTAAYAAMRKFRIYLRIDDAIDVVAVHLGCGSWGTLCVGLLAEEDLVVHALGVPRDSYGLLLGGGYKQILMQMLALAMAFLWGGLTTFMWYFITNKIVSVRVPLIDEYIGLDVSQHKCISYDYLDSLIAEHEHAVDTVLVARKVVKAIMKFQLTTALDLISSAEEQERRCNRRSYRVMFFVRMRVLVNCLTEYLPYLPDSLTEVPSIERDNMPSSPFVSSLSLTLQGSVSSCVTVMVAEFDCVDYKNVEQRTSLLINEFAMQVKRCKGALHRVDGGRITCVWQFISSERLKEVCSIVTNKAFCLPLVTFAICMGPAHCGNIGTSTTMAPLVHGRVLNTCSVLVELARAKGLQVLLAEDIAIKLVKSSYIFPVMRVVGKCFPYPSMLYTSVGSSGPNDLSLDDEEWCRSAEPQELITKAWKQLVERHFRDATTTLRVLEEDFPNNCCSSRTSELLRCCLYKEVPLMHLREYNWLKMGPITLLEPDDNLLHTF